jgi:anti-sigma regulatory factor (Ser/Thr protein kinase)
MVHSRYSSGVSAAREPRWDLEAASVLPPTTASIGVARHDLQPLLQGRFDREQQDVARLLVSELVTNAILYTEAPVSFSASVSPVRLRVEVGDVSRTLPALRSPDGRTGGWGLRLVNQLASRWGAEPSGDGKQVWFELDRVPPAETA